jgi:hypothetical protein
MVRWGGGFLRDPAMVQFQAVDGAVTEIPVDAFDDLRLQMLHLGREGAGDGEMQGSSPAFASGEDDSERLGMIRKWPADDLRPMGGDGRPGEAAPPHDRVGDAIDALPKSGEPAPRLILEPCLSGFFACRHGHPFPCHLGMAPSGDGAASNLTA